MVRRRRRRGNPHLFRRSPKAEADPRKASTYVPLNAGSIDSIDIPMQTNSPSQKRWLIVLAFLCVYFFWGSTFVAIRYAVRFLTPAFVSGLRSVAAGSILLLLLRARGRSLHIARAEWPRLMLLSWLLVTGNNLLLGVGEIYVSAGYAALLTASVPILVALIETALPGGKPLSRLGWTGTLMGIAGLVLLLTPALRTGFAAHGAGVPQSSAVAIGSGILLIGISCWVAGSVITARKPTQLDPFLVSAMQMLIGGTTNIGIGTAVGGWHTAHWTSGAFAALSWLAVFGSLIGFSAYNYLLHHVPVAKVATYAYVNPVVAVFLSAVFLHEGLHGSQWIAMAIILVAVAVVTASKSKPHIPITGPEAEGV